MNSWFFFAFILILAYRLLYWRKRFKLIETKGLSNQFQLNRLIPIEEAHKKLLQENVTQKLEICRLNTLLTATQEALSVQKNFIASTEERLFQAVKHSTQTALYAAQEKVNEQHQTQFMVRLEPFQTQLSHVHQQMQWFFDKEAKERHALTHELKRLQTLNLQLSEDALNLTQALKGQSKLQGNWGELILEKVLERAGLREGLEYRLQVSLTDEKKSTKIQPDAIVFLPEGKSLIIDAKVSLCHYEGYYRSETETDRKTALQHHLKSIRTHIKKLSQKQYHQAPELKTLDYVFLFIPIEGALTLALENDPTILYEAQAKQLMLVSPSSLLVALKTVHTLWRFDKQAEHAKTIAHQAARLYDKFRLLLESLQIAQSSLSKAQAAYGDAIRRLSHGPGNLLKQVEDFKQWGVEIRKPIESDWIVPVDTNDLNDSINEKEIEMTSSSHVKLASNAETNAVF